MLHSTNKCSNIIGYKFGLNLFDRDLKYRLQHCKRASLSAEKQSHVNCVHTLSLTKSNHVSVEGFDIDEINFIIEYIATE